jgi:hypothetical protein
MKNSLICLSVVLIAALFGVSVHALQATDRVVCGTNDSNDIYCTTYNGLEHGKWEKLEGHLKQVVVRDGHVWGVNAAGEIYFAADISKPRWVRLEGEATEITEGHGVICVVNKRSDIYCADKNITTAPVWRKAPDNASLKFVSVN